MPQEQMFVSFGMLAVMMLLFWLLLIRPQKKKDKETDKMRKGINVGDEIVTIGGIIGKVVRTKEESITIQVGADKTKIEIMRWGVSKVVATGKATKRPSYDEVVEEEAPKKALPKRMKRADNTEEA